MARWLSDLVGVLGTSFNIAKAKLDASGLTAARNILVPDAAGTLALSSQLAHPGYVTGRYYCSQNLTEINGNAPLTNAGKMYAIPFYIGAYQTFTKIGCQVVAGSAGSTARIGLYANSSGVPGTLLYDSGDFSVSSPAVVEYTGLTFNLSPGWYWTVFTCSTTNPTFRASTTLANTINAYLLGFGGTQSDRVPCLRADLTYGAFPATWASGVFGIGPTSDFSGRIAIWLRL